MKKSDLAILKNIQAGRMKNLPAPTAGDWFFVAGGYALITVVAVATVSAIFLVFW